jgi:hypothetical protein
MLRLVSWCRFPGETRRDLSTLNLQKIWQYQATKIIANWKLIGLEGFWRISLEEEVHSL